MKFRYKNRIMIGAVTCIIAFGTTLAFLKDSESKKNIVEIGNIKLELTEDQWTTDEKKAVPGQIFPKNPVLKNTGKNDEYVFLEVSMPMEEVQMLYEGDIYQKDNNYAIKIGNSYYQANIETNYKKTSNKVTPDNPTLVKPAPEPEIYTYENASGKTFYAMSNGSNYKIYTRVVFDNDVHYIDTEKTLSGNTPVFFKETSNGQDIYKYDDNGTEKYVVKYQDEYYQAVSNGSYYTRTNTIINNVVILENFTDPDMLYVYSYEDSGNVKYAVKKSEESSFYEAEQEITYEKTDTVISDTSDYIKTEYESGTKKGSEHLQEIFRTVAEPVGTYANIDGQNPNFSYHSGNDSTVGWILLEVNDITEKNIQTGKNEYYRKYLFGYNRKLKGSINNSSDFSDSTVSLFDKIQLKSFIDEKIIGDEKNDMNEEKQRYQSKLEKIQINAYGIQADNLSFYDELGNYLTKAQLNQVDDVARQKMG